MEYIFVSPLMLMLEQENLFSRHFRSFPVIQLGDLGWNGGGRGHPGLSPAGFRAGSSGDSTAGRDSGAGTDVRITWD